MGQGRSAARLDDLRLIAAIADHRTLSAASTALGLPKQTMSRRLALLEDQLGVRLVARGRRLRLTEDGGALAERAREIVRLAEEALGAARDAVTVPRGTLRIATTHTIAERLLAPVVTTYLARYPEVTVDLSLTERKVDLVEEGFDVAIRVGASPASERIGVRLGPARIRYVASPAYLAAHGVPSTPAALMQHRCLVHPLDVTGEARWVFVDPRRPARPGEWQEIRVPASLAVNSAEIIRHAACAGLGIAMLAEVICADDIAHGSLVPVLDAFVPDIGGIWLLTHERRRRAARIGAFVHLARAMLGPDAAQGAAHTGRSSAAG